MNSLTLSFLMEEYEKNKLLRESVRGKVWLVTDKNGTPAIMRLINHLGVPGKSLQEKPSIYRPKIIYFAEDKEVKQTLMVEEYVSGSTLAEELKLGRKFTEKEAETLLREMCKALGELHSLGIIHRDIKPDNIIWQGEKNIKLIDYDIARLKKNDDSDDYRQDTALLGTVGYAPPEQYGYSQTDFRSDIYALGITFEKILSDSYEGYLKNVLRKCHALDPEMRYQNTEEILRALYWGKYKNKLLLIIFSAIVGSTVLFTNNNPSEIDNITNDIKTLKEDLSDSTDKLPEEPNEVKIDSEEKNGTGEIDISTNSNLPKQGTDNIVNVEKQKNYRGSIDMMVNVNGETVENNTYFISSDLFRYWPRLSQDELTGDYSFALPDDYYMTVSYINNTNVVWHNPSVEVTYKSEHTDPAETYTMPDLAPGETGSIHINLGGRVHDSAMCYADYVYVRPNFSPELQSVNYGSKALNLQIYYSNDNGYNALQESKHYQEAKK